MSRLGVSVAKISKVLDDKTELKLSKAIVRDTTALNLNIIQINLFGPRGWKQNNYSVEEIKKVTNDPPLDIYVHSAYATTSVWKNRNAGFFRAQLAACAEINAMGLVLHVNKIAPKIIADVMKTILIPIAKDLNSRIILEMVSAKSCEDTYETPEKLNYVTKLIGINKYWGWCIDTAHIFASGVDITTDTKMRTWINKLDFIPVLFHLNGNFKGRGSGKDEHAIAGNHDDKIWKDQPFKKSGIYSVIDYAIKKDISVILEINKGSEKDVRSLINKINTLIDI